jgi:glycosyltransferase involved in cell wall biosynthesis
MATYNRPDYFKRAYTELLKRTHSPYRLHLINDGGHLTPWTLDTILANSSTFVNRKENLGIVANLLLARNLTRSEIIVIMDDDVLVPDLNPDWLARGLAALEIHPEIGMLSLNDAACDINDRRHVIKKDGEITYCGRASGAPVFLRRQILLDCPDELIVGQRSPVKQICVFTNSLGYRSGYLNSVYCWHFGVKSARLDCDIDNQLLPEPGNLKTLEPD